MTSNVSSQLPTTNLSLPNITASANVFSSLANFSISDLKNNSNAMNTNVSMAHYDVALTTSALTTSTDRFLQRLPTLNASQVTAPENNSAVQHLLITSKPSLVSTAKVIQPNFYSEWKYCQAELDKATRKNDRLKKEISDKRNENNKDLAARHTFLENNKGGVVCDARSTNTGNDVLFKFVSSDLAFPDGKVEGASIADDKCHQKMIYPKYSNCKYLKSDHCTTWLSSVDIVNETECNYVRNLGKLYAYGKFNGLNCHDYPNKSYKYSYSPKTLLFLGLGFGAGGMIGVASLCGMIYLFYKLVNPSNSARISSSFDPESQINRRAIIDPTKSMKKVRTGLGKKKLVKSKIDDKLPPQPSVGVKESDELTALIQLEDEKKIFPKDETDLFHYVRPVRPPKYADHGFKEAEVETALHQAHNKRVKHLKDQIEEANQNYHAAQLTLNQIKREGDNFELLYSAEKILFEEQQKLASLEAKYTEIMHSVKNEEKPHEAIHLPPSYEKTNIHHSASKSLEAATKKIREQIIDAIIDKNKTSVAQLANGLTINKTTLNQEKILDVDIALLSVKEQICQTLKKDLLEKTKLQLRENIVLEKSNSLKENITAAINNKDTINNKDKAEQLTQIMFINDTQLTETLTKDLLTVAKESAQTNAENSKVDRAYIANVRIQKMKDILAHNKSLVMKKQQQLNLLSPEDPTFKTCYQELKQLKIKAKDEQSAMELVKERELTEQKELESTRKIMRMGNVKNSIVDTISEKTAATITATARDIQPLASNLELIVNDAMRSRYKQKRQQKDNIEKLNAFIENTTDEEKREKAKKLLAQAMSLSNEIAAQKNLTLKFMQERDENAIMNAHSLGGALFNKLHGL